MNDNSQIISKMIGLLYPFILMFGFYIILNGHVTPGGGFQGGAVLSAVFISRYIVYPIQDIRISRLQTLEKALFSMIVILPTIFLLWQFNFKYTFLNEAFLVAMNTLIGIKVCYGLTIIFFRFVFYESR